MIRIAFALALASALPLNAAQAQDRLDEAMTLDVISRVQPSTDSRIAAVGRSLNQPTIIFLILESAPSIFDINRRDNFTSEEAYDYSVVNCEASVIYFTPVADQRVYVGLDGNQYTPQTLAFMLTGKADAMSFTVSVGGFAGASILETSIGEGGYDVTPGRSSATSQSEQHFESREAAELAAPALCDLSRYDRIELVDFSLDGYGISLEGEPRRRPWVGNTSLYLITN